jgi:hypothetical protein
MENMIISQFEVRLYKQLEDFFSKQGFELLLDKKQFRKTTAAGFQNIIFSITEAKRGVSANGLPIDQYWVEVNFGVRNNQVEQIAQQFLNNAIDFRSDANTLVINIGKFNDLKYFRFKIEDEDDFEGITEQISEFFLQSGLDFMANNANFFNLEKIINFEPNKPCKYIYNQVHRVFKGVIAAKLADKRHFSEIIEIYRNYLFKVGTDDELINYERLVSYLLYYSRN